MKTAIIIGTRPDIIKLAPVIKTTDNKIVIHTGQHYNENLSNIFISELGLAQPDVNLAVGSHDRDTQINKMSNGIYNYLVNTDCDIVVVHGDTNSAMAGALAANRLNLPIAHVEAGIRSYDNSMPEELNRVEIDKLSKWLFAPTRNAANNLKKENINNAIVCGNTSIDSIIQCRDLINKVKRTHHGKVIITLHRPSNTDNANTFINIIKTISDSLGDIESVIPVHPRINYQIIWPKNIKPIEPVGYFEFISLLESSPLVISDSGGIAEEACYLRIPMITMRQNTERPEAVQVGANVLSDVSNLQHNINKMLYARRNWDCPYGDGTTHLTIKETLLSFNPNA